MAIGSIALPLLKTRRAAVSARVLAARLPALISAGLMVIGAIWFVHLSIAGHAAHQTTASDLGYYSQAVWNTAQGRPFRSTLMVDMVVRIPGDVDPALLQRPDSLLAYHVEPILLLLGLIARWWPGPEMLLTVQALAAVAGAWAMHRLASRTLGTAWAGPVFAAVYLLAPPLHWAITSDFHPVVLGVGAVAFVYDLALDRGASDRERRRVEPGDAGLILAGLVALSAREDVALIVAPIALYRLVRGPGRWAGGVLLAACLGWLVVCTWVILPAYGTGDPSPFLARFSHLGGSSLEIAGTLITQPWRVVALLARPEAHHFWVSVTAMTGGLWPIGLPAALPALPLIGLNLLSNWPWAASGGAHYSILTVPAFVAAAAIGAGWLVRVLSRAGLSGRLIVVSWVLGVALWWARVDSLTPLNPSHAAPISGDHERLLSRFAGQIPADASLSASSSVFPHLDNRPEMSLFPTVRGAEYVLVDVTGPAYPSSSADQTFRILNLIGTGAYGVADGADGYLLLRRGETRREPPEEFWSFVLPGEGIDPAAPSPSAPRPLAVRWETGWDGPDRVIRATSDWSTPPIWGVGWVPRVRAHLQGGVRDLSPDAAGIWWMQGAQGIAGHKVTIDFPPLPAETTRSIELDVLTKDSIAIPITAPTGEVVFTHEDQPAGS